MTLNLHLLILLKTFIDRNESFSEGLLKLSPKNDSYIFDYDNQFIPTDKYDSKRSYKHADGYFPGIASIGNFPVYIENRNSNVKCKQDETLKRAYEVLGENQVKVKHSRMDCGSFDQSVVPVVEANSKYFYQF